MVGVESLKKAYHALGLPDRKIVDIPFEATHAGIEKKIANPEILQQLGVKDRLVDACYHAERAANLLDSFAETGQERFLIDADVAYHKFLELVSKDKRDFMKLITASALGYFHLEQVFARRIKRGDQITEMEATLYHASRGADSGVYAEVAYDDRYPGINSGFRHRQGLSDLTDEIIDLNQDKRTLGVNILLMANLDDNKRLREFASRFYEQTKELKIPLPLRKAIKKEYEKTMMHIN